MQLKAEGIGKRYRGQVVFSGIDLDVEGPGVVAVLGGNGSGKSTFLKILAGMLTPSRGKVVHSLAGRLIPPSDVYASVAFAGPYQEVVEEMTLRELLTFTGRFRSFDGGMTVDYLLNFLELREHENKYISEFSSGMKQRVKLGLALCSSAPFVFFDEPVSHLDVKGVQWYGVAVKKMADRKIIVVGSNHHPEEYPDPRQTLTLNF